MFKNEFSPGTAPGPDTQISVLPAPIACVMQSEMFSDKSEKPAVTFLKENGHLSLVSLGCGHRINRVENHLRLMIGLNLKYYVGIDCHPFIELVSKDLFAESEDTMKMLSVFHQSRSERFVQSMRLFPGTFVEELAAVRCAAVVCQRVYPGLRWEDTIKSMNPKLVLQEDLHGCERQQLRGPQYVRTLSNLRRYDLRPFRPWPIFPGEKNMVLWRRRDFADSSQTGNLFGWLRRRAREWIG